MRLYETLFILKPDLEKEIVEELIGKVTTIIETAGTIEKVDQWGKRKLAYEIDKKYKEGYYVVVTFKAENSVLDALDHLYKINEPFIRSIVIKKEK
jgi:small subunit ribosomal protein S6